MHMNKNYHRIARALEYIANNAKAQPTLEEIAQPGAQVPRDSYLEFVPTGPGFDLGIEEDWLVPFQIQ